MAEEAKEILANVILLPPSKVTESLKNKRLAAKLVQVAQRAQ